FGMFFFSSRRRHTRFSRDWSSDVCSSDLSAAQPVVLVGDFNSAADGSGTVVGPPFNQNTYTLLTRTYTDAFTEAGVDDPTCCQRSEERRVGKGCRSRVSADR